ncbi:unnamed protein product [Brassica oleracea]
MEWEDNHQYMVMGIVLVFSFWKCSLEKDQPMKYLRGTLPYTATSKSVLPERVMHAADEPVGLRVGFPIAECLTLGFQSGT